MSNQDCTDIYYYRISFLKSIFEIPLLNSQFFQRSIECCQLMCHLVDKLSVTQCLIAPAFPLKACLVLSAVCWTEIILIFFFLHFGQTCCFDAKPRKIRFVCNREQGLKSGIVQKWISNFKYHMLNCLHLFQVSDLRWSNLGTRSV